MYPRIGHCRIILALALACCGAFSAVALAQFPDYWRQATLYRDKWGVPHVYAETQEALGFAFGYAQAEDHLADMLMAYRMANGRAAEVLGEPYAESDAFSIKMGHAALAEEAWYSIDAMTAALCTGFAQGVNLWIVEHPDRVPEWAEGVKPQDILALWHAYLLSHAPMDMPEMWRRAPAAHTGNAWAVAPSRSASGGAMLVVNPHQRHNGFFRWYEAHLIMPGYNMYGATLFGLPVLLQGHNGMLGWALTPNSPDTADVYQEPITEAAKGDPRELGRQIASISQRTGVMVEYAARAQPYYVRTQGGLELRHVPQWIVDGRPVLQGGSDFFYTWRVGGYRNFGGLAQLFLMGGATSLEDFQSALYLQQLPCFHIVYADRAGNLFYLYNAIAGVRDANAPLPDTELFHWKSPAPPYNDQIHWGAVFTPAELPYLLNPASGYIQASGNPPWTVTDDPPYTFDLWPRWLSEDVDTYRARRVRDLLRSGTLTFQDMQNMLYDDVLPAAKDMAALLGIAAEAYPDFVRTAHPDLASALEGLRTWDYSAGTSSTAMTYFHLWWAVLQSQNPLGAASDAALQHALMQNTPETQQLMLDAAAEAVRLMRNKHNSVQIPWGEVQRMVRGSTEVPIHGAGTGDPIFITSDYLYKDDQWQVTYGYGFAMAVEFGDLPRAVSVVPFGASESPTSPHFSDQLELFRNKRFKNTQFLMEDVARHATHAYGGSVTLYPKGVDGAIYALSNTPVKAQAKTMPESPVPLPEGAAAFSLFMRPELTPAPKEVMFLCDVRISEALCATENLHQLALYAYTEGRGWAPLEEQYHDPGLRVFSGKYPYPAVFAVLGPKDALLSIFDEQPLLEETDWEGEDAPAIESEGEPVPSDTSEPARRFHFVRHDLPEGVTTEDTLDGRGGAAGRGPTGQRTFKFERHDLPEGVKTEDTLKGRPSAVMAAPIGQRQFLFERHNKSAPSAPNTPTPPPQEEASPMPEAEDSTPIPSEQELPNPANPETNVQEHTTPPSPPAPTSGEGPTGKRQFKFERRD